LTDHDAEEKKIYLVYNRRETSLLPCVDSAVRNLKTATTLTLEKRI
jgi:hypothetical protein